MKGTCKECGASFRGRTDKVFCGDQCRTAHYNRINRDATRRMRNINNALRRNRRVLENCASRMRYTVTSEELLAEGFNPQYCTACRNVDGVTTYYCYEYSYKLTSRGIQICAGQSVASSR